MCLFWSTFSFSMVCTAVVCVCVGGGGCMVYTTCLAQLQCFFCLTLTPPLALGWQCRVCRGIVQRLQQSKGGSVLVIDYGEEVMYILFYFGWGFSPVQMLIVHPPCCYLYRWCMHTFSSASCSHVLALLLHYRKLRRTLYVLSDRMQK